MGRRVPGDKQTAIVNLCARGAFDSRTTRRTVCRVPDGRTRDDTGPRPIEGHSKLTTVAV